MKKFKKRLYEVLEVAREGDKLSRTFDIVIISLIFLNVLAIIFESIQSLGSKYANLFSIFEIFSVIVFTIEYILRIWSFSENPNFKRPIVDRIKYVFSFYLLIDLLAILPFYLPLILDLRSLRAIRLFRLFRLLKIARYSNAIRLIGKVVKSKKSELIIVLFVALILLIIASTLLYYAEKDVQPNVYPNIPAAMWWGVATLTTVGYGDIYPITILGKIMSAIIAIIGIGIIALPTGIFASGFLEEIQKKKRKCPHCGKEI